MSGITLFDGARRRVMGCRVVFVGVIGFETWWMGMETDKRLSDIRVFVVARLEHGGTYLCAYTSGLGHPCSTQGLVLMCSVDGRYESETFLDCTAHGSFFWLLGPDRGVVVRRHLGRLELGLGSEIHGLGARIRPGLAR